MRKKIIFQFLVGNGVVLCNILLMIVLSRILSPDEVGVFSMAAILVSIAHVFRDFGVGTYLKQVKELDANLVRGAFGLLLLTSWFVAGAIFFSAEIWGGFFDEPRVSEVVRILALGFLFIPFGTIPEAILVREYAVSQLAKVAVISSTIYFMVSVALALGGFSYTTMAWANFINIIVSGFAYRYFLDRPLPWVPSIFGWNKIANFGLGSLVTSLLKVVDNSLPDIVLGKFSGAASVGLFNRANSTVNIVAMGVTPTVNVFALPYLSKTHHGNLGVAREFIRIGSIINSLLLPPLVWIALMATELVHVLYGSQWSGSIPVIPWLCGAIGVATMFTLTIPALQSIGKPYLFIFPLLFLLTAKGIAVLVVFDGTVASFAQSLLLGQLAIIPVYMFVNGRFLGVNNTEWASDILLQLLILSVCGGSAWAFKIYLIGDFHIIPRIVFSFCVFLVIYILLILVSRLPLKDEITRLWVEGKARVFKSF